MIIHIVATSIFWLNAFLLSKTFTVISNTKVPGQLVLVAVVDYKKIFCLCTGEFFQVHQNYEPRNTIDIDQMVVEINLGPQYNLQGGYLFEILLAIKRIHHSHWTPVNIT